MLNCAVNKLRRRGRFFFFFFLLTAFRSTMCRRSCPPWCRCKSPRAGCTRSSVCLLQTGPAPGPCGRRSPGCPGAFGSTFYRHPPPPTRCLADRLGVKPVTLLLNPLLFTTWSASRPHYGSAFMRLHPQMRDYAEERRVKRHRESRRYTGNPADCLQSKSK